MLTQLEAHRLGYTVDNHAPGRPIAYKGPRFATTEEKPCFNSIEEALIRQTRFLLDAIKSGVDPTQPIADCEALIERLTRV